MVGFFAVRGYRAVVVRRGVLPVLLFTTASLVRGQQPSSLDQLVQQFESDTWFSRQFHVAKAFVAENDRSVLPRLEPWLTHKDRCLASIFTIPFAPLSNTLREK